MSLSSETSSDHHSLHISRQRRRRDSISSSDRTSIHDDHRLKHPRVDGNMKYLGKIDCGSEILCCRFYHDGSIFALGLANGVIKVYKTETYACIYELSDNDIVKDSLPCTSLLFIPSSESRKYLLIATYASGLVKHWHFTIKTPQYTFDEGRQILCSSLHLSTRKYSTAGADSKIQLYDIETKKNILTHFASDSRDVMNGHRQRVLALQYHPSNPNLLLSGGWDDTVQFWDDRQEHAVKRIYGPHICGEALDIDPLHNHVMTGSWRKGNELQIWNMSNGRLLKDVPQDPFHQCMLYCCQWIGEGHMICGGNEQNMAQIIDRGTLNTVAQITDFEGGVFCLDHDRSSHHPKIIIGAAQSLHVVKFDRGI